MSATGSVPIAILELLLLFFWENPYMGLSLQVSKPRTTLNEILTSDK